MVKIVDVNNNGSYKRFTVEGFETKEQAQEWVHEWGLRNFGYTPLASVELINLEDGTEKYVAYCKVWNSCD